MAVTGAHQEHSEILTGFSKGLPGKIRGGQRKRLGKEVKEKHLSHIFRKR
jgi:hypothetical protein